MLNVLGASVAVAVALLLVWGGIRYRTRLSRWGLTVALGLILGCGLLYVRETAMLAERFGYEAVHLWTGRFYVVGALIITLGPLAWRSYKR